MEPKTTIFHSEMEFREYVISSSQNISLIVIFEDVLDHTIFFYGIGKDSSLVATKECKYDDFSSFKNLYQDLAKKIHFSISNYPSSIIGIKLVSRENKKEL